MIGLDLLWTLPELTNARNENLDFVVQQFDATVSSAPVSRYRLRKNAACSPSEISEGRTWSSMGNRRSTKPPFVN